MRKLGLASASIFFIVVSGGCSGRHSTITEEQFSKSVVLSVPQKDDLQLEINQHLTETFRTTLKNVRSQNDTLSSTNVGVIDAVAAAAGTKATNKLVNKSATECQFSTSTNVDSIKCVIKEILVQDLSSVEGLRKLIEGVSVTEASKVFKEFADMKKLINDDVLAKIAITDNRLVNVESVVNNSKLGIEAMAKVVNLLRDGNAISDLPWLSDTFFSNRKFLLTNSLQVGSIGVNRMYNLNTYVVRISVENNKFVIHRLSEGLSSSSNTQDMLIGVYPILDTRQVGTETYYQVNFSVNENKRFLLPEFYGINTEAKFDMTAESTLVRISHNPKPLKDELKNKNSASYGFYFDSSDNNLVLDQQILLNTTFPLFNYGIDVDAFSEEDTLREILRPTLRVVQGLLVYDDSFEKTEQKMEMQTTMEQLFDDQKATNMGKDFPYFSGGFTDESRDYVKSHAVRKYNTSKPITFVLSASTPEIAVPVLKSAVLSYSDAFAKLTPAGQIPVKIEALTQQEWEERTAFTMDKGMIGADPRVNMIVWEDNPKLNYAWATTLANPLTGEVISADVMLTGVFWGNIGCNEYMKHIWKPNSTKPAATANVATELTWQKACKKIMSNMKIRTLSAKEMKLIDSINIEEVIAHTKQGDNEWFTKLVHTSEPKLTEKEIEDLIEEESLHLNHPASQNVSNNKIDSELVAKAVKQNKFVINQARKILGIPNQKVTDESITAQRVAAKAEHDHKHNREHAFVEVGNHSKSLFKIKVDCVLDTNVAGSGDIAFNSDYIKSPEDAILAMIRSTLVHELGHTFGLRHNFLASTTPAIVADNATVPAIYSKRSDSIMDYTDSGIYFDLGAMADYKKADSLTEPSLGIYDLMALATAYNLDTNKFTMKIPAQFCSDNDVGIVKNCARHDSGKDSLQSLSHQMNQVIQNLRQVNDKDIYYKKLVKLYFNLFKYFDYYIGEMIKIWGTYNQEIRNASDSTTAISYIKGMNNLFYGEGLTENFYSDANWMKRVKMKPLGIYNLFNLSPDEITADPSVAEVLPQIFSEIIRKKTLLNYIVYAPIINDVGSDVTSDNAYIGEVQNIKADWLSAEENAKLAYQINLKSLFSQNIMRDVAKTSDFVYTNNGKTLYKGKDCLVNGVTQTLSLDYPVFNHKDNLAVRDIKCGNDTFSAAIIGNKDITELMLNAYALASLGKTSSIQKDIQALSKGRKFVSFFGSTSLRFGLTDEKFRNGAQKDKFGPYITPEAREPARFMGDFLNTLADNLLQVKSIN